MVIFGRRMCCVIHTIQHEQAIQHERHPIKLKGHHLQGGIYLNH
jgi:hypothetical protein